MVPGEAARGVVTNAMPNNATGLISLRCSQGRQAFALGAPHQRTFVTFDRKQIAHHFGGSLLTVACVRAAASSASASISASSLAISASLNAHATRAIASGTSANPTDGISVLKTCDCTFVVGHRNAADGEFVVLGGDALAWPNTTYLWLGLSRRTQFRRLVWRQLSQRRSENAERSDVVAVRPLGLSSSFSSCP